MDGVSISLAGLSISLILIGVGKDICSAIDRLTEEVKKSNAS